MKIFIFKPKTDSVISDDSARRLTQEFLAGSTTIEQEHDLYRYYASGRVAHDLECHTAMFQWYDQLGRQSGEVDKNWPSRKRFIAAAAAIAVLVLVGVTVLIPTGASSSDLSLERMYAGSYIIRDGKKITDISQILPELQQADRYVDSTLDACRVYHDDNYDEDLIREALANINDPEVKAMLLADIL